jgi:hypothetical protein
MTTARTLERENQELRVRIANAEAAVWRLSRGVAGDERDALAAAQARADSVACHFGERVSAPTPGETSLSYRRRILRPFLQHSPQFKEAAIDIADDATLGLIENRIFVDATNAARTAAEARPGVLTAFQERDGAGRLITKFSGDMMAWLSPFVADGARCSIISSRPERRK